jgi:hypothetical protein
LIVPLILINALIFKYFKLNDMKEQNVIETFDDRDLVMAYESLNTASFKKRFIKTANNAANPEWNAANGEPIKDNVNLLKNRFKNEFQTAGLQKLYGGVFQKYDSGSMLTLAHHRLTDAVVPAARDLFHVYGPDRDNKGDWKSYYRYAWKEEGPNAIIYSTDSQIIREGKLGCNSYAYSGQGSYAIVGAGMLFRPLFGDAMVNIRPYAQWLTSASFTGTESTPASAIANIGIYVESWQVTGGGHYVDRDLWMPVWSQNTKNYILHATAGGAATVSDGLATDILCVTQRKYAVFVYVYLETSASPQQQKNEQRFVTLDIDAAIPYVVLEEKLI